MKSLVLDLEDIMVATFNANRHRKLSRAEMIGMLRKSVDNQLRVRAIWGDPRVRLDETRDLIVVNPSVHVYVANAIDLLLGPGEDGTC